MPQLVVRFKYRAFLADILLRKQQIEENHCCAEQGSAHRIDIRVRLWTAALEGRVASGVSFSRWLTIFSIVSIDLDSFFSIRSARAESFGLDEVACK